jgi:hypothetical protein
MSGALDAAHITPSVEKEMAARLMPRLAAMTAVLCIAFAPAAFSADPPAMSPDGLRLVKNTEFAVVYVKPGATLKPYTKFAILNCFVSFAPNWRENMQTNFNIPITEDQIKQTETELAAEFKKVFVAQLEQGGYQLTTDAGPNVLVLRPAIINLQITAPQDMEDPDETTFSTSAGQMTLFLELYDSVTSELLARVIDPEDASNYGIFTWGSKVGNIEAADQIMTKWSDTLRHYMEAANGAQ